MIKKYVKSLLAGSGFRIENMRNVPRQFRDVHGLRTLEFDDLVCRRMFEVGTALTFIQVGAFDGETKDPLRRYIQSCGWRGIMIEPQRSAVAKLRSLYYGNLAIEIVEAAIDRQCGTRTLFTVEGPGVPDWCGGLASFDRETIVKHKVLVPDLEQKISAVQVDTTTFDTIFARLSGREIDVLQVDTEGADSAILSLFPFDQVRPVIVHWEVKHLTTTEQEATFDRLSKYGYRFAKSGSEDMLAALI